MTPVSIGRAMGGLIIAGMVKVGVKVHVKVRNKPPASQIRPTCTCDRA